MTEPHASYFISAQARILITEWKSLAKLIATHSSPSKEKPITLIEELENFDIEHLEEITFSTADEMPNTLSEKQIQTALQGPFGNLLRDKMAAYAKITRFRLELHLNKEELFKGRRAVQPENMRIPAKKLEKTSFSQLDQLQADLDALTKKHDQEWQQFTHEWTEKLIEFFAHLHLTLTDRELEELRIENITTELLPRFVEVGLKLPKKAYPRMSFVDYLYLKAMLAIQSALSRQHLAHDDDEIQQKLWSFKPALTQMQKQEQQLLEEQKKLTTALLDILE